MRKTASSKRPAAKGKSAPSTVAAYLDSVPEASRNTFLKLRALIRSAMPGGATETISYKILAFKTDRVLVWVAAFSKHCSLFPTASVIEKFEAELKGYGLSKGTIQFPLDKPLPAVLIKKIVKARVAEAQGKKAR